MTEGRLRVYRRRKAAAQQHRCYYCQFPMWTGSADSFARSHNITLPQAARFRCTAEHLKARCDGGTSCVANIVAACEFCNKGRHHRARPLPPDSYLLRVRRRVAKHRWHPPELHRLLRVSA